MKNLLLFIAFCLISPSVKAQGIQKDASGNYFAAQSSANVPTTLETLTKNATKTAATFTTAKGEKFPVYLSKSGAAFVVRTSKKGIVYRQYMPK